MDVQSKSIVTLSIILL